MTHQNGMKEAEPTSNTLSPNGHHVIYTYTDIEKYLKNAASYIAEGIDKDQTVIYIDRLESFESVQQRLKDAGYAKDQVNEILFVDADEYYATHDTFNVERIKENFKRKLLPYLHDDRTIRAWGLVTWKDQDQITLNPDLAAYECTLGAFVSKKTNFIAVCAYDGLTLPSSCLMNMLHLHEYYMTDKDFSPSPLYHKKPVVFPSISEQIKVEQKFQDQVIRSEELSAAGELAASIAHELRNPLTVARGYLQLIDKTVDLYDKGEKYLHTVSEEMEKIERISSEFLSLAKPNSEHKTELNIYQLIENVKVLMEPQALKKTISIDIKADDENIRIIGYEMKIKQVFVNLVKNAIEAMSRGNIILRIKDATDYVYIDVADNGPGIPDESLKQLGQPFYTTKETGTGLGLLISEKIIEDHNGKLRVESTVGTGTTFTISLPKETSRFRYNSGYSR